jgi:hypothetical protein
MDLADCQSNIGPVAQNDGGQLFADSMLEDTSDDPLTELGQTSMVFAIA